MLGWFILYVVLYVSFICLEPFLELVNECNFVFQFGQVVKPIHCLREWDESNQEELNDEVHYEIGPKKRTKTRHLGEKHCLLLLWWLY